MVREGKRSFGVTRPEHSGLDTLRRYQALRSVLVTKYIELMGIWAGMMKR